MGSGGHSWHRGDWLKYGGMAAGAAALAFAPELMPLLAPELAGGEAAAGAGVAGADALGGGALAAEAGAGGGSALAGGVGSEMAGGALGTAGTGADMGLLGSGAATGAAGAASQLPLGIGAVSDALGPAQGLLSGAGETGGTPMMMADAAGGHSASAAPTLWQQAKPILQGANKGLEIAKQAGFSPQGSAPVQAPQVPHMGYGGGQQTSQAIQSLASPAPSMGLGSAGAGIQVPGMGGGVDPKMLAMLMSLMQHQGQA